jgi:hypothetical protein
MFLLVGMCVLLNLILDIFISECRIWMGSILSFGDDAHNQLKLRFLVEEEEERLPVAVPG